jgi:hypothetical protein
MAGQLPYWTFRGLLSVRTRYGLHARGPAWQGFTSQAQYISLPPCPIRLLPAGTVEEVAGRGVAPRWVDIPFHGAHITTFPDNE